MAFGIGEQGDSIEAKKHSAFGIASFIMSIAAGILLLLLVEVAGALEASTPGGIDGEPKAAVIVGTTQIVLLGIALGAFGLGIAGLLHKDRKRIFAVLGISLLAVEIAWTSFLILDALAAR